MALTPEQHVALPMLVGAPAYARPPRPLPPGPKPVDPDDFPIEAHRTDEDRVALATGRRPPEPAMPVLALPRFDARKGGWTESDASSEFGAVAGDHDLGRTRGGELQPRTFSLRSVASRILGDR